MRLTINGYRKIDRAELIIPEKEITLVAGKNAVGKTSVIQCLQYNASANPFPLGLAKKDIPCVVHAGAEKCEISLESESGKRTIYLPQCEVKNLAGVGVNASRIALGFENFGEYSSEQMAKTLNNYLNAGCDRARLAQELSEIDVDGNGTGLTPEATKSILDTVFGAKNISAKGWEAGEEYAKKNATMVKQSFRHEAGVNWGTGQGVSFVPAGWEPGLESETEEALKTGTVEAREKLERAIAVNAVSEKQLDDWKAAIAEIPEIEKRIEEFQRHLLVCTKQVDEVAAQLQQHNVEWVTCSECGMEGHVVANTLVAHGTKSVSQEDLAKLRGNLNEYRQASQKTSGALAKESADLKRALEYKEKLATAVISDGSAVQEARAAQDRANARLTAWKKKQAGTKLHYEVMALLAAADILTADGLRKRTLLSVLESFNKRLSALCERAGWRTVAITSDLKLTYAGLPFVTISESEQYRTNATLQVALSLLEHAELVIFDRADVLDRDGRNELFRLLAAMKLTAVIGMTVSAAKDGTLDVPNLRALQKGITYWADGVNVRELNAPVAVA